MPEPYDSALGDAIARLAQAIESHLAAKPEGHFETESGYTFPVSRVLLLMPERPSEQTAANYPAIAHLPNGHVVTLSAMDYERLKAAVTRRAR